MRSKQACNTDPTGILGCHRANQATVWYRSRYLGAVNLISGVNTALRRRYPVPLAGGAVENPALAGNVISGYNSPH